MIDKKTASLWHEDKSIEDAAPGDNEPIVAPKPTVYLFITDNAIGISSYPSEHADCERYTMEVLEFLHGRRTPTPEISINILRNVLEQAGVQVVIE